MKVFVYQQNCVSFLAGGMSFWASKSYSASTVDQILDKEYFTLDELLDATEIVQETQALNGALIAYLTKPDTVHQLLNYVLAPQTPGVPLLSFVWKTLA